MVELISYASDKYGTMPIGEQIGKHVLGPTPFWFATVLILINHIIMSGQK